MYIYCVSIKVDNMLESFLLDVQYGINHVLDINAYDHVLFLIVLAVPSLFKDWKRVLMLVTMFTLGHSVSLLLSSYGVVKVDGSLVEFLIPVTIMIFAVYNVFTAGKSSNNHSKGLLMGSTLFFGLIHGFGFGREFRMILEQGDNKLLKLVKFALGIEIAQIIIVFVVLFLGYLFQTVFRFSKRDWVLIISSIVIGLVIPMILNSSFLG